MATRPAIAPLPAMPMSKVRVRSHISATAARTPNDPASVVIITISGNRPSRVLSVEPGLKPYHPSHRMKIPIPNSGMLWPGIACGVPSLAYFPRRGPSSSRTASAAAAAVTSTTIEPAKSCTWMSVRSQPSLKIQWATSG